jgi:hypothetical protein
MEPTTYFTIFVLGVGALHLTCQAVNRIGTWMGKTQQHMTYSNRTQNRDDWYVFFHRSKLNGSENSRKKNTSLGDRPSASSAKRRKRSRRLVARVNLF